MEFSTSMLRALSTHLRTLKVDSLRSLCTGFVGVLFGHVQESRRAYVSPSRVDLLHKLYWKDGQV